MQVETDFQTKKFRLKISRNDNFRVGFIDSLLPVEFQTQPLFTLCFYTDQETVLNKCLYIETLGERGCVWNFAKRINATKPRRSFMLNFK